MGCDIHMYVEKRLSKSDAWQLDENHAINEDGYLEQVTATGRNYILFGLMAEVRGNDYLYSARGTPNDISDLLRVESEGPDNHSNSWLTLDEFKNALYIAKYDLTANKSCDAFYEYNNYPGGWNSMPEDYTTIVNYCEQWVANELAEAMLLNRTDIEPEVRLIFWFDN